MNALFLAAFTAARQDIELQGTLVSQVENRERIDTN